MAAAALTFWVAVGAAPTTRAQTQSNARAKPAASTKPAVPTQPTPQAVQAARAEAAARKARADAAAAATAAALATERHLAEQRVNAAARAKQSAQDVAEAQARLTAAQNAVAAADQDVAARVAALRPLLPVMRRVAVWPEATLLAVPAPPGEALSGLLALQGVARHLRDQAAALRTAAAAARTARTAAAQQAQRLQAAQQIAAMAEKGLSLELQAAQENRQTAQDFQAEADRRAADSAAKAQNLAGALRALEVAAAREAARQRAAEARAREAAARAARQGASEAARDNAATDVTELATRNAVRAAIPKGGRALPVSGDILQAYGSPGIGGRPTTGITFGATPGTPIVSPCGGRAVFAAPFRSYGQLLIIDCGGGYHFVLAGLGRLDASTGQRVLAGEPVGIAGGAQQGGKATLYVELRSGGRAIDPQRWFNSPG